MSRGRGAVALALLCVLAGPARADDVDVRAWGTWRARFGVDTGFDSPADAPFGENVLDQRQWLYAGVDARLSERYRLVLEARARQRFVSRRAAPGEPFLLLNGQRRKSTFEAEPGEAYLAIYFSKLDLVIGNQVFAWGANVLFSPADRLNALDLRQPLLVADPVDLKIPAPAISARGELGPIQATAVVLPFFVPHRSAVFGQDEGLLQPALQAMTRGVPAARIPLPDPSVEDALQPLLLGTRRPQAVPTELEAGLRLLHSDFGPRIGASYLFVHERLPRLTLPPQLAQPLSKALSGEPVTPDEA
ncbi:MAG: hypothetical protein ACK4N5_25875, partial [Myxococcales bacterium]